MWKKKQRHNYILFLKCLIRASMRRLMNAVWKFKYCSLRLKSSICAMRAFLVSWKYYAHRDFGKKALGFTDVETVTITAWYYMYTYGMGWSIGSSDMVQNLINLQVSTIKLKVLSVGLKFYVGIHTTNKIICNYRHHDWSSKKIHANCISKILQTQISLSHP